MTVFAVACDADVQFERQTRVLAKCLTGAINRQTPHGTLPCGDSFTDRERQPEIEIVSGRLSSTQGQTEPYRLGSRRKSSASSLLLHSNCRLGAELFFLILPFFAAGVPATMPFLGVVFLGGSFLSVVSSVFLLVLVSAVLPEPGQYAWQTRWPRNGACANRFRQRAASL